MASCTDVGQIQVIWSDQENSPPPLEFFRADARDKIEFEVHETNSLNHRFNITSPLLYDGVYSTDDDILVSCEDLRLAFQGWEARPYTMVGFTPRMVTRDHITGRNEYHPRHVVQRKGVYNIILTKGCFLHRRHLELYTEKVPKEVLSYIDDQRNCEDIAMSLVVAGSYEVPPLWVEGTVTEIGKEGIRSLPHNLQRRSQCLDFFQKHLGGATLLENTAKLRRIRSGWRSIFV